MAQLPDLASVKRGSDCICTKLPGICWFKQAEVGADDLKTSVNSVTLPCSKDKASHDIDCQGQGLSEVKCGVSEPGLLL